ncbi:MAG: hypothetical protein GF400_02030, partial [Candidatus Eisenbacteria bacterium]|nr:hypothetical protein [Candidatus Eisenbacteria bacterium]
MVRTGGAERPPDDRKAGVRPEKDLSGASFLAAGTLFLGFAMLGCGAPVDLYMLSLPELADAIKIWRWVSLLSSWVLLPVGVFLLAAGPSVSGRDRSLVARNGLVFLAVVAGLATLNYALI